MVNQEKVGKLTLQYRRRPEAHEFETAEVFIKQGIDVEFLAESQTEKAKSADILMAGIVWEIKAPTGNSRRTIERLVKDAVKQSPNVIIDARRCKLSDKEIHTKLNQQWKIRHTLKRLMMIDKNGKIIDFHK